MDQELLEILMESLRKIKGAAIIDQAFLQMGFIRSQGFDILSQAEINQVRRLRQQLSQDLATLAMATNRLLELEQKYQDKLAHQENLLSSLEAELQKRRSRS
ncbi:MAG: hypothetical protein ACO1NZ_17020 [Adhaeribacter sp.]